MNKITCIYAREDLTVDYLNSIGVAGNIVRVCDPAFLMKQKEADISQEIIAMLHNGALGFNISPLVSQYRQERTVEAWADSVAEFVDEILVNFDCPIILIPHVTTTTAAIHHDDHTFLTAVYARLKKDNLNKVAVLGRDYNAPQTKWVVSQLQWFIGARTHSTIAAYSSAVPTIALGYSMKSRGIIRDLFENEDWLVRVEEADSAIICEKLKQLMDQSSQVRERLKQKLPKIESMARNAAKDLVNYLK